MKHIPSLEQAEAYVREAEQMNPGPWVAHSRYVAQAASAIALRCPPMNADVAYTLGLLHDIGRREGVTAQHHIYAGYVFMLE
ncbi:MAG TPA: HDOD domain-containing protein, partial [Thermoflexales bacterium]|nr:HDOD domain-containing protein [Thermoflexales bacterium]